jgi:hypothetical protein
MFKIKVRPHKHNRYLYDVTIYERSKWLIFTYWKWWCGNVAIPDWGIDEYVKSFREKHKVCAIDFLISQEIEV